MAKLFYIPLTWDGNEYSQLEELTPDELDLFSQEKFESVIKDSYVKEEAIIKLITGKFLADIYKSKANVNMPIFCLVNEKNLPENAKELKLDEESLQILKENLSINISLSEGIVGDQQISITNDYVAPRLSFSDDSQICFYEPRLFSGDYIISGPPGSGKTTLLRRLTIDWLDDEFSGENHAIKRLPIYVQLRDFNRYEADFDTFINFSIKNSFSNIDHLLPSNLSSWGNLYLLLDGADELDFEKFKGFTETLLDYKEKNPFVFFIVTTRPDRNYEKLKHFSHCKVEPFSRSQIKELTYRKFGKSNSWKDFISILNTVPRIYEILKNPLLLTFSHFLYIHQSVLPTNTAQLLKELVSTLISSWDSQRGIERRFQNKVVSPVQISHFLGSLAFQLADSEKTTISSQKIFENIRHFDSLHELEKYLEYIEFATGLLRNDDDNGWGFRFKSIQDFFCSAFLTESVSTFKKAVFTDKSWSSVLQMISGLSSDPGYIMKFILHDSGKNEEEKLETTLNLYKESMLLNKHDIEVGFAFLEHYFLKFESKNNINSHNIISSDNEVVLSGLSFTENQQHFIDVLNTLLNARFSKYELDFNGYLSNSNSFILRSFYPLTIKKGNIIVKNIDGVLRIQRKNESPEISD